MKLSLLSFDIAKELELPELLKVARTHGYVGVELRTQLEHKHGVDVHLDKAARQAVRDQFDQALVDIAGLGVSNRFEYPEPDKRFASVEEVKKYVELAADLDASRVRVFGNDMPRDPSVDRADVLKWVGDCLRELGEFAEPFGIEVNLEMHGQFNWWRFAVRSVEWADHPNIGIVYNCDPRDVIAGSIRETISHVLPYLRHIHMHDLSDPFPYRELFGILDEWGYDGYLSAEIGASSDPERVLAYYAALYRALLPRP